MEDQFMLPRESSQVHVGHSDQSLRFQEAMDTIWYTDITGNDLIPTTTPIEAESSFSKELGNGDYRAYCDPFSTITNGEEVSKPCTAEIVSEVTVIQEHFMDKEE